MGDFATGFRAIPIRAVQGFERAFLRQPVPMSLQRPTPLKIGPVSGALGLELGLGLGFEVSEKGGK